MQAALVIINGYPGAGKSSIAKELAKILPNSQVIDTSSFDQLAQVHSEGSDEALAMRKSLRLTLLKSLPTIDSTTSTTVPRSSLSLPPAPPIYILPETLYTNPHHRAIIDLYATFATNSKFTLISIVLPLPMDIHLSRASQAAKHISNAYHSSTLGESKERTEDDILALRMTDEPAHFFPAGSDKKGNGWEWEVDTKDLGIESSAFRVAEYIMEGMRKDGLFVTMRKAKRGSGSSHSSYKSTN